ncbi:MAG: RNA polymerase sigma factor [Fervidobacterium sp.]|nr:RNA polymerase sigma factor [Fervidobacterium sp.]
MEFSNSRNERSEENQGQNTWKDESLFIKALSKGDEEAYRYLYKTYAPKIGALVKSYLGTDDIDDVIQEVFLRIYKNIKKFRGESKLSTWIYRITVNVCNNVYKKLKSKGIIMDITESNESDEYTYQFPTEEDVKKNVADEILYEKLRKTLDTLNPEDRALLFMKEIDGLTYEEIGNILKKPEGTVKSRLHYIKEKIRKALEEVTRDE